jgi:hypothetical protein
MIAKAFFFKGIILGIFHPPPHVQSFQNFCYYVIVTVSIVYSDYDVSWEGFEIFLCLKVFYIQEG